MTLSIVSPVYNSESSIDDLVKSIRHFSEQITSEYEIILVDDGSLDNSWKKIEENAEVFPLINGIKLSRNFGQHNAISAGLTHAKGDWIVVMDCDLQDNPAEIVRLYEKAQEGFSIVTASRIDRKDTFLKKKSSLLFWKLLSYLIGIPIDYRVANFGIYHKNVINAVNSLKENFRFFPTMILWTGFKKTSIQVTHNERHSGKTAYSYYNMLKLAVDIILANTDMPIRFVIKTGLLISTISFFAGVYYLFLNLTNQIINSGYTNIIISIWFLGGLVILNLGIFGLYLSKIFEGIKGRPNYIVEKKTN